MRRSVTRRSRGGIRRVRRLGGRVRVSSFEIFVHAPREILRAELVERAELDLPNPLATEREPLAYLVERVHPLTTEPEA